MIKTQVSDTGMVRTTLVIRNRKLNPNQSEQKKECLGSYNSQPGARPTQGNLVWASKESTPLSVCLTMAPAASTPCSCNIRSSGGRASARLAPNGVICLSLCQIPWLRGVLSTSFVTRLRERGWLPTDGSAQALGSTVRASLPH